MHFSNYSRLNPPSKSAWCHKSVGRQGFGLGDIPSLPKQNKTTATHLSRLCAQKLGHEDGDGEDTSEYQDGEERSAGA